MAPRTSVFLSETVEVPTEVIVDPAGELYALDDLLVRLNGMRETPLSDAISKVAASLLEAIAPHRDGEYSLTHPAVVEVYARSKERHAAKLADLADVDAIERMRQEADAIRDCGHAFGPDVDRGNG